MTTLSSASVRIPRQARDAAARVAEQTGESVTAVIARAVKRVEDELFYERLAKAALDSLSDYHKENDPWMRSDLGEAAAVEAKFWR
ncbi:MAG: hypothetical protein ACRDPW_10515 [Mycobacteriales bacterium]